jgi:hypothetical protein
MVDPALGSRRPLADVYGVVCVGAWYGGTLAGLLAALLGYVGGPLSKATRSMPAGIRRFLPSGDLADEPSAALVAPVREVAMPVLPACSAWMRRRWPRIK